MGEFLSQVIGSMATPRSAPLAPPGSQTGCSQSPKNVWTPDWGSWGSQNPFRRKKTTSNCQVSKVKLGGLVGPFSVGFGKIGLKSFLGGPGGWSEPIGVCDQHRVSHGRLLVRENWFWGLEGSKAPLPGSQEERSSLPRVSGGAKLPSPGLKKTRATPGTPASTIIIVKRKHI